MQLHKHGHKMPIGLSGICLSIFSISTTITHGGMAMSHMAHCIKLVSFSMTSRPSCLWALSTGSVSYGSLLIASVTFYVSQGHHSLPVTLAISNALPIFTFIFTYWYFFIIIFTLQRTSKCIIKISKEQRMSLN